MAGKSRYLCPAWELRSQLQAELGRFLIQFLGSPTHQFVAASGLQRQQSGLNNTTARLCRWSIAPSRLLPTAVWIRTKLQGIYKRLVRCGDLIDYYENQGCSSSHPLRIWYHSVQNRPSKSDATVKRLTERTRRTGGELLMLGQARRSQLPIIRLPMYMLTIRYTFPRYALCWKQLRVLPRS